MSSSGAKKIDDTRSGYFSACVIDENKVLITYLKYPNNNHYELKARVLTISGTNIVYGTELSIAQTNNGVIRYIYSQLVTIDKNKVFLIYDIDTIPSNLSTSKNYRYKYACVLTINNGLITKGTDIAIDTTNAKSYTPVRISNYQILLLYAGDTNRLIAELYTITGNTIKLVGTITLNTVANSGLNIKATALSQNKVLIICRGTSSIAENLSALICTITGNIITVDKENAISLKTTDFNSIGSMDLITLSENKVLLLFTNSSNYICCRFYNIEEDTVIESVTTQLSSIYSSSKNRALKLNENKILMGYFDSNNYLHDILCDIEDSFITITGNDVIVSTTTETGRNIGNLLLLKTSENNVFAGYSFPQSSTYILAQNYFDIVVKTITSSNARIDGIALSDAQAGEIVQVKKPNV